MAPPGCGGISPDAVAAEREGSRTAERNRVIGRNGAGSVKGVRIGHVRRIVGKSQVSCVLEGDVFRKDDGPFGSVVVNVDVMASREGSFERVLLFPLPPIQQLTAAPSAPRFWFVVSVKTVSVSVTTLPAQDLAPNSSSVRVMMLSVPLLFSVFRRMPPSCQ